MAAPETARQRRRREEADANEAAILDAAVALLAERPSASMAAIAEAARLSRQTVYAHFPSRRELLDAAVTRAMARAAERIEAAAPDDGPADAALERVVATSWRIVADHGALLEAARAELPPSVLRDRHAAVAERLAGLVDRGRREGCFDTALPADWLLAAFFALLHAAAEQRLEGRSPAAVEAALAPTVLKLFRAR